MNRRARGLCSVFVLFLAVVAVLPAAAAEIVTVSGRPSATQSYLLMFEKGSQPAAVAVLFPGGDGLLNLRQQGEDVELDYKGNFLVRTRGLLRDAEVAVAIVDVPSDLKRRGYSDAFRQGPEHAADMAAVVRDLRGRFKAAKIFLVGTSRGTVSAAYVGRSLGKSVDGVVLTSSVSRASSGNTALSGFRYADLQAPLLLVHHVDDGCHVSPYGGVQPLAASYPLVSVHGGKPPQSDPCEAHAPHGFFGKEAETIAAIKAWMLGRPFPKQVE